MEEILHQSRLVAYPIILEGFVTFQAVGWISSINTTIQKKTWYFELTYKVWSSIFICLFPFVYCISKYDIYHSASSNIRIMWNHISYCCITIMYRSVSSRNTQPTPVFVAPIPPKGHRGMRDVGRWDDQRTISQHLGCQCLAKGAENIAEGLRAALIWVNLWDNLQTSKHRFSPTRFQDCWDF